MLSALGFFRLWLRCRCFGVFGVRWGSFHERTQLLSSNPGGPRELLHDVPGARLHRAVRLSSSCLKTLTTPATPNTNLDVQPLRSSPRNKAPQNCDMICSSDARSSQPLPFNAKYGRGHQHRDAAVLDLDDPSAEELLSTAPITSRFYRSAPS